jgi:serine/threonine-protein kinase
MRQIKADFQTEKTISDRYSIERVLGQGGMAVVYEVHDEIKDRNVALKRLLEKKNKKKYGNFLALFESEFHTLSELAHPRIVEVYDYGVDAKGPYYTMELLNGDDLRSLSPLPWKRVCSLLRDICSALTLLHSRRRLHRDLSPRNIHCTLDGKAKLIDFGAMEPMGPCQKIIGTPAYTAPEVVSMLNLDGRADLYSLGATAYYALTGHSVYPNVATFKEIRNFWKSQIYPPSTVMSDIPKELSDLVMSLLNIEPDSRPPNAGEVMEKLSAIAGLPEDKQLQATEAYLTTPTLVGREKEMERVRTQLAAAERNRCSATLIEGRSGLGRTRLLEAQILEAKLQGAIVLRATGTDTHPDYWGGVRSLLSSLLETVPDQ